MDNRKTLSIVISETKDTLIRIMDNRNCLLGSITNEISKENVIKVYGHLPVIRTGSLSGLTAIQVQR